MRRSLKLLGLKSWRGENAIGLSVKKKSSLGCGTSGAGMTWKRSHCERPGFQLFCRSTEGENTGSRSSNAVIDGWSNSESFGFASFRASSAGCLFGRFRGPRGPSGSGFRGTEMEFDEWKR
ncbi:hypothetical protein L596_016327 [Steinernema carpocapsae]|uniref:Uncharacterized protein n=1 Tax=Steinernema carpocapsae TaxID=34508 RepID=A0A4U5NIG0_STECR|nr:hypothetical protein L596_016327 [Steinernema carpocapsae]